MTRPNIDIGTTTFAVRGFCSEYQSVYDALTTPPSGSIAAAQNTMVKSLVDDGVWTKLDVFYCYAQHTNDDGEALINWTNPGTYDATAYNSPTFTALEGFTGDGSSTYIDCNWNPSANGVNFTQDDASLGLYARTQNANGGTDAGVTDLSNLNYIFFNTSTFDRIYINSDGYGIADITEAAGMKIACRTSSTAITHYINKSGASTTRASTAKSNANMYVLARNSNDVVADNFIDRQISLFFAGSGFTQTNVNNLTDAIETYMDSNGKGVIS